MKSLVGWIVLLFLVATHVDIGSGSCDNDACSQACQQEGLSGHCDSSEDKCECDDGVCDAGGSLACMALCKAFSLDGECEDGRCKCTISPEGCEVEECILTCEEWGIIQGCIPWTIQAESCVEYGPITWCACSCKLWDPKTNYKIWKKSSKKQFTPKRIQGKVKKMTTRQELKNQTIYQNNTM